MSCKPIKFQNVPPDVFKCMKKKLQDYDIHVPPGNRGELSGKGVTADFEWDGTSSLTITITEKPFIVSCDTAARKIKAFVKECHGS
ncbi:hypothetical protein EO98_08080 [Methanosarcina sp. 2.H.T.1A.6]|uniref:hypothetical protein n=1 Tax=unclassified Methanosarcina TaxID=2644672 RepID=UPI0006212465|nr:MULTISPECIES: hypothetical protein [unclassified Methanosarcina]KKG16602.1 hypothetical protein EO94_07640 [Methanosarcina sp. 2.H.T.1A.3]KKG19294.1 hypothetical protein EO97_06405 [Methanosarcina sp. 2.H.T.1A.15]KKG25177.1 hypothetical protein EO98_08080 [Methanosarcina sp. 2.H.T.1A.6]KKG26521.1 hypothetical protein EO96_06285 [Methanosarcina sp. 2.H.T.1A.8]